MLARLSFVHTHTLVFKLGSGAHFGNDLPDLPLFSVLTFTVIRTSPGEELDSFTMKPINMLTRVWKICSRTTPNVLYPEPGT